MSFSKNILFGSLMLGASVFGMGTVSAATITVACSSGTTLDLCKESAAKWAEQSGHQVDFISMPASASEILALYQQILAAQGTDIDVYQIDVIWPGTLAPHMIDMKPSIGDRINEYFPAIIQNNTVGDKLVGVPYYTDAGLLYYRTDLLEKYGESPPETWAQLEATAKKIQDAEREAGNNEMWGFVWQGRAYEGLTCDALEWVYSHKGGTIVAPDGEITINNPNAAAAIKMAAGWVDKITPQGVLNYAEEEARGIWQTGNAVFMRNWPYAWALSQGEDSAIKGKVGMSVLPKGGEDGQHAATLGGWQLAVSQYSKNQDAAADLVAFLTSKEELKMRAIKGSFLPTMAELYKDQEVLDANPFMADLYEVFTNAVARPSTVTGAKYNQMSTEFFNAVHSVLSGSSTAEDSLANLEGTLKRLSRGGRW